LLDIFQDNEKRMLCTRHKRLGRCIENMMKKRKIEKTNIAKFTDMKNEENNHDPTTKEKQNITAISANDDTKKDFLFSIVKEENKRNDNMEKKETGRDDNPITIIQWVNENISLADRELVDTKDLGGIVFNNYKSKYKKEPDRMYGKTGVRVYRKKDHSIIEESFQSLLKIKKQQSHVPTIAKKFEKSSNHEENNDYFYDSNDD